MADNLRKYTTQEVLNKVYTDSSGITIGLNSQTSKETLNAVLDSSNNRLQVAMAGGTIDGDVTISGDLTVQGGGSLSYDEIVEGTLKVTTSTGAEIANFNTTGTSHTQITINASTNKNSNVVFHENNALRWYWGYNSSDNRLRGYSATGGDVFSITDAGSVGIGATSPIDKLTIFGNTSGSITSFFGANADGVRLSTSVDDSSGLAKIYAYDDNDGGTGARADLLVNNHMTIKGVSGLVGIGTSSPQGNLSITASSNPLLTITETTSGTGASGGIAFSNQTEATYRKGGIYFNRTESTANRGYIGIALDGNASDSNVDADWAGNTKMAITYEGNVGIGTTSPSSYNSGADNLVIADSADAGITLASGTSSMSQIFFADGTSGDAQYRGVVRYNHSSDDLIFWTAGATRMTITSSGGVKFGGSSAADVTFEGASGFPDMDLTGGQARIKYNTSAGNFENGILFDDGVIKFMRETSTTNFSFVLDANSSISLSNNDNGTKNTIFGFNAGVSLDAGSNYNTFIGANVSDASMNDAVNNTGVGYNALSALTSGDNNVSIGTESLKTLADGTMNIAIGNSALYSETGGDTTIAIGQTALYSQNVTSGVDSKNVGIGYLASYYNVDGTANVSIGYEAMKGDSGITTGHSNNIAIGYHSLLNVSTGNENVVIGSSSGKGISTGYNNTYIGHGVAANSSSNGHSNTFIGSAVATSGAMTGNYNVAIGRNSFLSATSASNNVIMGYQAGDAILTDINVVAIGYGAYSAQDTANDAEGSSGHGSGNIAIGYQSMQTLNQVNCLRNTAVGFQTMSAGTSHDPQDSVAIGYRALQDVNDGDKNTVVGSYAGSNIVTMAESTIVGYKAGVNLSTGTGQNVAIGSEALSTATSMFGCTAVGYKALQGVSAAAADDNKNTGIGWAAGYNITTGIRNTAIGASALLDNQTASDNTAVGQLALENTTGAENTAIGRMAGNTNTSGINNVFVGKAADSSGNFNYQTALGWNATTSGNYEVAVGMNGIKKFKTARITLSSFSSGNNGSGKIYSNGALFTIPAYSFVKRVVVKIVTLSSNADALLAIGSSATTDSAIGDSISSATYYIRHSSLGTGYSSRSQASTGTDVAVNIGANSNPNSVVGMTFIGAIDDNNAGGWLSAEHAFYVVHAGSNTNSDPTTDPVIDVLVEYY